MTNKDYHDLKEENFVDKHTTHVATPQEELPFEIELPEDEEPAEDIPFEEVMPENAPSRKNVSEELPRKKSGSKNETIKNNNQATEDKSDDITTPVQL